MGFGDYVEMIPEYFQKIKLKLDKIILKASETNSDVKYAALKE